MEKLLQYAEELDRTSKLGIFAEPVDADEAPSYADIVLQPMDLRTCRTNMRRGVFSSVEDMRLALELMYDNCQLYNEEGSPFHKEAKKHQRLVSKFCAQL
jgi:hypothetical protein